MPALFADHGWLTALTRRGTSSAAQLLLALTVEGVIGTHPGADWWLVRTFAAQIQAHGDVRAAVYERHSTLDRGAGGRLIEGPIAEAADRPGILLLVRSYGAEGRTFDDTLHTARRHVALGERPACGWSGAKEIFCVPAPELRRDLFHLIEPDRPESAIAEACLTAIDELRDEFGAVESEPRHSDVTSGRPWPRLAI